jgi:hypothetical protein
VLEASNELVRFRADTRQMVAESTTYINTYVDTNAIFYVNSSAIAGVFGVVGTGGVTVAALVCGNGQALDLYGYTSSLSYTCASGVYPTPASGGAMPSTLAQSARPASGTSPDEVVPLAGVDSYTDIIPVDEAETAELHDSTQ